MEARSSMETQTLEMPRRGALPLQKWFYLFAHAELMSLQARLSTILGRDATGRPRINGPLVTGTAWYQISNFECQVWYTRYWISATCKPPRRSTLPVRPFGLVGRVAVQQTWACIKINSYHRGPIGWLCATTKRVRSQRYLSDTGTGAQVSIDISAP